MLGAKASFDQVPEGLQIHRRDAETAVLKLQDGHAFGLISPTMHKGRAFATFQLKTQPDGDYQPAFDSLSVGIFPADLDLTSDVRSADGKRCALRVWDSFAQVMCNGAKSTAISRIDWKPGDTVCVEAVFKTATAVHVSFIFKGHTEDVVLQGVPACGLRFGAGLYFKGDSVALVACSAGARPKSGGKSRTKDSPPKKKPPREAEATGSGAEAGKPPGSMMMPLIVVAVALLAACYFRYIA